MGKRRRITYITNDGFVEPGSSRVEDLPEPQSVMVTVNDPDGSYNGDLASLVSLCLTSDNRISGNYVLTVEKVVQS